MIKEDKVYIAGPMTWIPQFNYPAFDKSAAKLRSEGLQVWSPAEVDNEEIRKLALASKTGAPGDASPNGETWGDFLAQDIKIVSDIVDAVVVIPGWSKSKGARLETFVAYISDKPIYYFNTRRKVPLRTLISAWIGGAISTPLERKIPAKYSGKGIIKV